MVVAVVAATVVAVAATPVVVKTEAVGASCLSGVLPEELLGALV